MNDHVSGTFSKKIQSNGTNNIKLKALEYSHAKGCHRGKEIPLACLLDSIKIDVALIVLLISR